MLSRTGACSGGSAVHPDSKFSTELNRLLLTQDEEILMAALGNPADTLTQIWVLHTELCQKASKYAVLVQQPMEYFHVSTSELKELASDKERLVLLMMKIQAVDELLTAKTGPSAAAAPS